MSDPKPKKSVLQTVAILGMGAVVVLADKIENVGKKNKSH